MFGSIARRYDLANHLLSCGCDVIWRKRAAGIVATWDPNTIVDLAAGTGDLTLALEKALPNSEVVAADFSDQMLAVARAKGVRRVVSADALALTTRRTPLALATASIWSEKSAATTSEFGNAFSNASVRSPVPAARSTIVFGSQ